MNINAILNREGLIRLDIGCGPYKQPGFIGMDNRELAGVDIVHDLEETPWPLPDECVTFAVASHVLEHINPHKGTFIRVMDEIWRVLVPAGQFNFVVPYAGSHGYYQDPTHCNPINETTMAYFDPGHHTYLYRFYEPKPWEIKYQTLKAGMLEGMLTKRPQ